MKLLLLGAGGQVGRELRRCLAPLGEVVAAARHPQPGELAADLGDLGALERLLAAVEADWIVNAAAYTAVDRAEDELDLARRINGDAVGVLARHAAKTGCGLVHYSTDYVFDGLGERPYREDDPVDPVNAYGASKLAGEQAIAASDCKHLLLRTAWVYGNHGRNFLRSMLGHAASRDELRIVDDQRGAPAWSRMLAQLTALAVHDVARHGWQGRSGTYHLSAAGETTWFRFAERFITRAGELGILSRIPALHPISTAEFPTPARRPAYSVLDNSAFERAFGLRVPGWATQLEQCLQDFENPHD